MLNERPAGQSLRWGVCSLAAAFPQVRPISCFVPLVADPDLPYPPRGAEDPER